MSTENTENADVETASETVTDHSSPEFAESLVSEFGGLFGIDEEGSEEQTVESKEVAEEAETPAEAGTAEAGPEAGESADGAATEEKTLLSPRLAEAAAREREARAKITALEQSKEQEIAAAVAAVVNELKSNPQDFIRKYELDPGDLALHAYAAELGDEAPAELKQQLGMSDSDRKFAELQAEIAALRQEQAQVQDRIKAQTALEQYQGYLNDVPAEYKYLGAEASHDKQEALRAMAEVADYVFDAEGRIPSAAECAKVLDDQIRATLERYSSIQTSVQAAEKPTASNVAKQETKQETTLTNDLSAGKAKNTYADEDERFREAMEWANTYMTKR